MTYFKRAEREAADQIDWGAISKGIVESINTEKKAREEKRTQIDKESADIFREISDSPASPRADLTSFTVDFSSQAQNMMRTLNTELKAGNITLADYTLRKQNLLTSTKQMYGMISGWGKVVSANMERINNGLESNVGIAAKAFVERAGNFENNQAYIDPATGNVVVAPKGLSPEEIAANASNIKDMFAALNQNVDKVDFKASLKSMADAVENQIVKNASASDKTGKSISQIIDNTKSSEAYKKYIETVIGGIMNNPMTSAKYLMDELPAKDGPWEATQNPEVAKANPDRYVLYQKGPAGYEPVLNEAQKGMVRKSIEQSVDAMIGTSTGKETTDNVSVYERDAMEKARIRENKRESVTERNARLRAEDEALLTFEQRRAIERRIAGLSSSFLRDVVGPLLGKQSGTTGVNTLNESSLLKMSNKKLLEVAALIESNTKKFGQSSLVSTDTRFLPEAIAKAGRMSSDSEEQATGRVYTGKIIEGGF